MSAVVSIPTAEPSVDTSLDADAGGPVRLSITSSRLSTSTPESNRKPRNAGLPRRIGRSPHVRKNGAAKAKAKAKAAKFRAMSAEATATRKSLQEQEAQNKIMRGENAKLRKNLRAAEMKFEALTRWAREEENRCRGLEEELRDKGLELTDREDENARLQAAIHELEERWAEMETSVEGVQLNQKLAESCQAESLALKYLVQEYNQRDLATAEMVRKVKNERDQCGSDLGNALEELKRLTRELQTSERNREEEARLFETELDQVVARCRDLQARLDEAGARARRAETHIEEMQRSQRTATGAPPLNLRSPAFPPVASTTPTRPPFPPPPVASATPARPDPPNDLVPSRRDLPDDLAPSPRPEQVPAPPF